MPSPATEKRPWSNNHPGLIGKRGHCTKTEVAAKKAAKETEAVIAAAVHEQVMDMLAEIEIEQAEREASQQKAVTHKCPGARACQDIPAEGSSETSMDVDKDLTKLINQEMEAEEEDEDGEDLESHQSDVEKVLAKKVGDTSCIITLESNLCCYPELQFQELRIVEGSCSQEEGNSTAKGSKKVVHHMFDHQSHISSLSYSGTDLPIVSGLKDAWKAKSKNVYVEIAIGGLTNEHASLVHPKFTRGCSLKVNLITILVIVAIHAV